MEELLLAGLIGAAIGYTIKDGGKLVSNISRSASRNRLIGGPVRTTRRLVEKSASVTGDVAQATVGRTVRAFRGRPKSRRRPAQHVAISSSSRTPRARSSGRKRTTSTRSRSRSRATASAGG